MGLSTRLVRRFASLPDCERACRYMPSRAFLKANVTGLPLQLTGDRTERVAEVSADQGEGRDSRNGDQCSNQRIFDGGGAAVISHYSGNNVTI